MIKNINIDSLIVNFISWGGGFPETDVLILAGKLGLSATIVKVPKRNKHIMKYLGNNAKQLSTLLNILTEKEYDSHKNSNSDYNLI